MKKIYLFLILAFLLSFTFVSAMQVDFFYSETCPYCNQIYPFVIQKQNQFSGYVFNFYKTSDENNHKKFKSYGFTGVPAFVINTNDGREITFTGANSRKLNCELQEMSTKDCQTYSADNCIGGSWFLD